MYHVKVTHDNEETSALRKKKKKIKKLENCFIFQFNDEFMLN